jgi:hypothetical protein
MPQRGPSQTSTIDTWGDGRRSLVLVQIALLGRRKAGKERTACVHTKAGDDLFSCVGAGRYGSWCWGTRAKRRHALRSRRDGHLQAQPEVRGGLEE